MTHPEGSADTRRHLHIGVLAFPFLAENRIFSFFSLARIDDLQVELVEYAALRKFFLERR